ncbi:nucleotide exchange factor GrpE [Pigmentiphaga aceris]|uniref:Protein GrpE n=1 Tax=Pigmentiphaga aceris TaxID=1940612 RepID=A0A5C0AXH5_9BURK|nr:nucleotide exchange factor GrpE [Pigmentiphaga aceris]QEI07182.1 nucleotide exchange factor GrpE [Pigmentiphaga aceris]
MSAEQTPGQPSPPANQDATQPGTPDPVQNDAPGTAAPVDPIADLEARLAAAQAKADDNYDQLLRARAETENVRRRGQEDVNKAHKFAVESFAESLVPVKDSLEAALAQKDQTVESLREGVEITLKQLTGAFERNKLNAIAPAAGDKFDPHQHQAISSVPSELPANTVVQTLQKGYLISDRVLRPALVTVSAGA